MSQEIRKGYSEAQKENTDSERVFGEGKSDLVQTSSGESTNDARNTSVYAATGMWLSIIDKVDSPQYRHRIREMCLLKKCTHIREAY
jgi:hypothetical protein